MLRAHTVEQVRAAERELMATLPPAAGGALMERAAHGLAAAVLDLLGGGYGRRVLLLVGGGDNGGDALLAGATLARRGVQVLAWPLSDHPHAEGLAALRAAGGRVVSCAPSTPPDLVLDGVVGIGGRPGLRDDAREALAALAGVPVVAVDVPSGVDVDTGELDPSGGPHVEALLTVTFGTHKVCHLLDPAAQAAGAVHLVDIGLRTPAPDVEALQEADVRALLPRPSAQAQKYSRGVVGVRAGSTAYPGAGLLSVGAASCGLVGMVRYVGDDAVAAMVHAAHPEVVVGTGRVQAWIVGSGSGTDSAASLKDALADDVPTVIDADALEHAPRHHDTPTILTPHAGELAGLLRLDRDVVEAQPLAHARRAADVYGATVLLKGRRSVIATADGRTRVNTTGTPWLATAGAGDVLGGLVATLAAAGLEPFDAASVGAWLHGAAATAASRSANGGPITAGDVARRLPALIGTVMGQSAP